MRTLEGRVTLITGALRGIGHAIAQRFLREGAVVVLTDLASVEDPSVLAVLSRLGAAASYLKLDVAQESDWLSAEKNLRSTRGRLDVLVNNAGIDCNGPLESLELVTWRRTMSINVDGVFLGTKIMAPLMAESGRGSAAGSSVINMSSVTGIVGFPETAAYCAGKGAVRLFTKAVALEFAQNSLPVRVNSLHPGYVNTPLFKIAMEKAVALGKANSVEELVAAIASTLPKKRLAEPAEVAGAALFLASDDSSYCTGSELVVDGGLTAQ